MSLTQSSRLTHMHRDRNIVILMEIRWTPMEVRDNQIRLVVKTTHTSRQLIRLQVRI